MKILLPENTTYDLNEIPEFIDEDLRYCILDYSDPKSPDIFFFPLIFLDSFPRPCADLQIGPYKLTMPLDWSVVIADKNSGAMEIIELKNLNDRDFTVFAMNPINGYMPSFFDITIQNIFPDVNWVFPKLKYGHILAIPLSDNPNPLCAFFLKDLARIPDQLDITKIF